MNWGLIPGKGKRFSFLRNVQTGSGPTQPPIQWVPGLFPLGVKWQGPETDHSPPSGAKVKNGGPVRLLSHTSSRCGA
jgi:hypothetical protein